MTDLSKKTAVVGSMTAISRCLGFLRDVVLAHIFGAGVAYDAFLLAFRIPNMFRRLFAEGAFSQAFIPVLTEYKDTEETQEFVDKVAGTLFVLTTVTVILGILLSPFIIKLFAPGLAEGDARYSLSVGMLKVTFPYLIFISLTAFASSILNTNNRFLSPAITPIFLNIAFIIAAYIATMYGNDIRILPLGVIAGGVLQLAFQIPFLKKIKIIPSLKWGWHHPGVQKIFKLMLPALLGVAIHQINLIVDMIFASYLTAGSISWLYYADRLMELPLGMFGVAIATVSLPSLSKQFSAKQKEKFYNTLDWAIKTVFLVGAPSAVGLYLLAEPIMITLFQRGAFDAHDVAMTQLALKGYVLGIIGLMLSKVVATGYYAQQDTKTPVKIAGVTLLVNVILNYILMQYYQHVGLALATSFASLFNAFCLLAWIYKKDYGLQSFRIDGFFARLIISCFIMYLVVSSLCYSSEIWLQWNAFLRFKNLFFILGAASISYIATLHAVGFRFKQLAAVNK